MNFKRKEEREKLKKQLNWLLFSYKAHLQSALISEGVNGNDIDKRCEFIDQEFQKEFRETIEFVKLI